MDTKNYKRIYATLSESIPIEIGLILYSKQKISTHQIGSKGDVENEHNSKRNIVK